MAFRPSVMPQGYNPFAAFLGGAQSGIDLSQKRRAEEQRMNILARQLELQEDQATRQEQAHEAQMQATGYRRPDYQPSTTQSVVVPSTGPGVGGFMPALVPALQEGETIVQSGAMKGRAYDPNYAARQAATAAEIAAEGMLPAVEEAIASGALPPGMGRIIARYPQLASTSMQVGARTDAARQQALARVRSAEIAASAARQRATTAQQRQDISALENAIQTTLKKIEALETEPSYDFAYRERQYNAYMQQLAQYQQQLNYYIYNTPGTPAPPPPKTVTDLKAEHPEWFTPDGSMKPEAADSVKTWMRDNGVSLIPTHQGGRTEPDTIPVHRGPRPNNPQQY